MGKVTIFKDGYDITSPHYIQLETALLRIKEGNSRETVEEIRKLKAMSKDVSVTKQKAIDKQVDKLKMSLPSVMYHGVFNKPVEKTYNSGAKKGQKYTSLREDESIGEYSGLLILDFDKVDATEIKLQLKDDPYIHACWVSPSGNGVKALVRCPNNLDKHYQYYDAFIEKYPTLDTTSKSISRLCFESVDSDIYINLDSQVWDKVIVARKPIETTAKYIPSKRNYKAFDNAVAMVRSSYDGIKHETLLRAAKLLGGYIAGGTVNEDEAVKVLLGEITAKGVKDMDGAEKAIRDGIEYGKSSPIYKEERGSYKPEKKEELNLVKPSNYLVSDEDMDKNIEDFYEGRLVLGRGIGIEAYDYFMRYRQNAFYFMVGRKGGGKTTIMLYLLLVDAVKNDSNYIICGIENSPYALRNQLVSFMLENNAQWVYINQKAKYKKAIDFVKAHFRFINYNDDWLVEDILKIAKALHNETPANGIMVDPYNAITTAKVSNTYQYHVDCANKFRMFSDKHFSVFLTGHPTSSKQREGTAPSDVDAEGGGTFPNKAHVTISIHRDVKAEGDMRHTTDLSIDKVREKELFGGDETLDNFPIRMVFNSMKYGFKTFLPIPNESGYMPMPVNLIE